MATAFAKIRIRNGIGPLIEVVVLVLIVNVALILRNRFLIEQEGVIGKQFDRFVVFHRRHSMLRRPLQRSREWKPPDMTVQKTAVAVQHATPTLTPQTMQTCPQNIRRLYSLVHPAQYT